MEPELLFEEIQSSGKKTVRDFTRVMALIFLIFLVVNLVLHKFVFNGFTAILVLGLCFSIIVSIASYTSMITQIRTDGIYVRFPPFQPTFSRYEWSNILDVYIRQFDAVSEFNGWGIRSGAMGKAYIISGKTGIQIVFRDKRRVLISTSRPNELAEILKRMTPSF